MKLNRQAVAAALLSLVAIPAFADTFTGKLVWKNAAGEIESKSASVELAPAQVAAVKLKIAGVENLAEKVKVKRFAAEHRTIVLAAFRNVRNMPEGVTVIVKGSLLDGSNGKLFYGDVLSRKCKGEQTDRDVAGDTEDSYLQNLLDGIQALQQETGCATEYRGGILLARATGEEQGQEQD